MRITGAGLGNIGLPFSMQFASRGHEVLGADVNIRTDGTVMNLRGSVIPLFIQQLQAGKPLTLNEPLMTRFLMSLEQSIDLVYHAFFHAAPGDPFVRKAPAKLMRIPAYGMEAGNRRFYEYVPKGRSQHMIVHVAGFNIFRRRINEAVM